LTRLPRIADRRSGSCTEPGLLHLALVFNLSHTTASRYAAIAQDLLDDQIAQATGQRPADQRYASDQPTEIPRPVTVLTPRVPRDESSVRLNSRATCR